jgi:hypothetical protein
VIDRLVMIVIVMNRMMIMIDSDDDDDDNDTCMKYTVANIFLCCYMHQLMCFISCTPSSSSFEL